MLISVSQRLNHICWRLLVVCYSSSAEVYLHSVAMATAAVLSCSTEPSELECPVCSEYFTVPKLLPCAHLVCRACLVSWCRKSSDGDDVHCPLCRYVIVTSEQRKEKSLDNLADELHTDQAMAALVEATVLLSAQHVCCVCDDVAAVSMCLQCADMFCRSCARVHKKQSLSKNHDVEDLSSLTAKKLAASRRNTCSTHNDKMCELFCPSHAESICHLCAASKHRKCPDVQDLEEKVKEARKTFAEMLATLSSGENELERAIRELDQQLSDIEKQAQAAMAEIRAACDQVDEWVKGCRNRLTDLVTNAISDVTNSVTKRKTHLVNRRVVMTSHKRVVERVQDMSVREADMSPVMASCVEVLDCSAAVTTENVPSMSVKIDQNALRRIERELGSLGQLTYYSGDAQVQEPSAEQHQGHQDLTLKQRVQMRDAPLSLVLTDVTSDARDGPVQAHGTAEEAIGGARVVGSTATGANFKIAEDLTLKIYVQNITESKCRTIVIASDKDLEPVGSTARNIARTGGLNFAIKCAKDRRHRTHPLRSSEVTITVAHKMERHGDSIIHAVVPSYDPIDKERYTYQLAQTFNNCLHMAKERRMANLSFPFLGFEDSGAPVETTMLALVTALLRFGVRKTKDIYSEADYERLTDIHLVDADANSVSEAIHVMEKLILTESRETATKRMVDGKSQFG
ncbi:hypothetical protein V1264_000121 [Littorina saxatilis]|uniref:RING-type E3 ubiquitin transferase n=2 Tax=Littorina saxatilis TaxID=31220 RepID=A0AAN9BWI4_9CAEN